MRLSGSIDPLRDLEGIVYKITNLVNGRSYIGKSENSFHHRYLCQGWGKMTHNEELKADFNKHGPGSFRVDILVSGLQGRELAKQEETYIQSYNTLHPKGYNLMVGVGEHFISDKTREKLSKSVRASMVLFKHPWKGKKAPDETRLRMSLGHQGRKHPKARAVVQIDKTTKQVIKTFASIAEAELKTGVDQDAIGRVCSGHRYRKTTGGYIWRYLVDKKSVPPHKKVLQIDIETGETLHEHLSIVDAARFVDGRRSNISAVCRGKTLTSKGFKWKFSHETT